MSLWIHLLSSLRNLKRNKMRTVLTMLGVIIGVFSVVMLSSIGEGIKREITAQVQSLGANLIYVFPGRMDTELHLSGNSRAEVLGLEAGHAGQGRNVLTYDDLKDLKTLPQLEAVSPIVTSIAYLNDIGLTISVTGTDEDLPGINKIVVSRGRFISKEERENTQRVAVLGDRAAAQIFKKPDVVGKYIHINNKKYQVVGVLAYKPQNNYGPPGENINLKIFVPVTTVMKLNRSNRIDQIVIKAPSAAQVNIAARAARDMLLTRHQSTEFTVLKQDDILKIITNILGVITASLAGIAAISLLVGGIGIMNIMLVSVSERTREIGIRKAVGARRRDIWLQFLIEAGMVSMIGGVIGLVLGIVGADALPKIIPAIKTSVSWHTSILALGFSLLVGIFFGVYPAVQASRLDPIAALRHE